MSDSENDTEVDADQPEDGDNDSAGSESVPAVWFAMPLWRLWLFTFVGGWPFQIYWLYVGWAAYRRSWGYSKQRQWRLVHAKTGFRISPFWRAALQCYSYALLVAIQREARAAGVRGMGRPGWWFTLHGATMALALGLSKANVWWYLGLLSVSFLPAQATVNRLSDAQYGGRARKPTTSLELVCLLVGGVLTWSQVARGLRP